MIIYNDHTNLINATIFKSISDKGIIQGYDKLYNDLKKAGITPTMHWLDNEALKVDKFNRG